MNLLTILSTFKTPEIAFSPESGELKMSGRVFPENPKEFFSKILSWVESYSIAPAAKTTLILRLTYFNSSSNEYIFRLCKMIESIASGGNEAEIIWEFEVEDDDMRQLGEDFKELLKINFEIKAVH